ncbi:MAG: sulfatase, partial [Planctomycetota bacterium]
MAGPNILLITSDQQHWMTLGVLNPRIHTPNLDRLAAAGTLFQRAYCPNPTCTPTRASIITGQYPSQHGAWTLGTKLPESTHCVGDDFHAAGYHTALIGKAHFQPLSGTDAYPSLEAYPVLHDLEFWRGFDQPFYGFRQVELARNHTDEAHVGQHYALWMEERGCSNWRDYFRAPTGTRSSRAHAWELPEEYHYNTWIAERSCAQMDAALAADRPFFIWSSFFDPHPSYCVPEPWASMYDPADMELDDDFSIDELADKPPHFAMTQDPDADWSPYRESGHYLHGMHYHGYDRAQLQRHKAVYYGMVSMMDHYIGRILEHLEAIGETDNTFVVFTTDHGHFIGEHGLSAKGPFLYEDMIRIPFIARWPGRIPAGATSDGIVSLVDLAPSFLAASGLPIPRCMSGRDQSAAWCGDDAAYRDHAICEHHHEPTTVHLKTFVEQRWKITVYYDRDHGELY